jgi:hypothetical protein
MGMEEKRLTIEFGAVDDWLSTCEQNVNSRLGALCLLRGFLVRTQKCAIKRLCVCLFVSQYTNLLLFSFSFSFLFFFFFSLVFM